MPLPQTIFFDAVGTLFGVHRSVGEIYGQFAQQAGFSVDTQQLNQAFIANFRNAPRAAFPQAHPHNLVQLEYEWWRTIAQDSFEQVGVQLANFDPFFQPMFAYFATAEPWFVYPEVPEVLARLKALGYQLAIISNFDSRLSAVLRALNLDPWFETVTISTQVGAAKPERAIFEAALAQQHCPPNRAWHVGDSWPEDYEGARAAGLWGVWLNRARAVVPSDHPNVNATLLEIETLTPLEAILSTQSQP